MSRKKPNELLTFTKAPPGWTLPDGVSPPPLRPSPRSPKPALPKPEHRNVFLEELDVDIDAARALRPRPPVTAQLPPRPPPRLAPAAASAPRARAGSPSRNRSQPVGRRKIGRPRLVVVSSDEEVVDDTASTSTPPPGSDEPVDLSSGKECIPFRLPWSVRILPVCIHVQTSYVFQPLVLLVELS